MDERQSDLHPAEIKREPTQEMSAAQAIALCQNLKDAGVRCWVMGGWGIDALLGRQTRTHHDLDLLLHAKDLFVAQANLRRQGFERKLIWEESRTLTVNNQSLPTAYVAAHPDGRELDVHVISVDGSGKPVLMTDDPWLLPADTLNGSGTIEGQYVDCVSREAQVAMHKGYELPDHHIQDLQTIDGSREDLN